MRAEAPGLFQASLIPDSDGLLAFTKRGVWRWDRETWARVSSVEGDIVYADSKHGLTAARIARGQLERTTSNGRQLDRRPTTLDAPIVSGAFDPPNARLLLAGGPHGIAPWTIALRDAAEPVALPLVSSVVFDPTRSKPVGLADVARTANGQHAVPPVVGVFEGDQFVPIIELEPGARAISQLAFDHRRRGVVGFFQRESGEEAILHVLQGSTLEAMESIPAPPLNVFRLLEHQGELIAWGGEAFEGNPNSLWLHDGRRWREHPPSP